MIGGVPVDIKMIIIISIVALVVILFLTFIIVKKQQKASMIKKVDALNIMRNEVLSIPFLTQIDKVSNLTKGEQLEEKIHNYLNIYNELKEKSFKDIDDRLAELDFTTSNKASKDFWQNYAAIELELYQNRYLIFHLE